MKTGNKNEAPLPASRDVVSSPRFGKVKRSHSFMGHIAPWFFKKADKGMTLIEVVLVMGIFSVLATLGTINLLNARSSSSLSSNMYSIIADIKTQQTKAMTGDTEGRSTSDYYSVYISSNSYTLFHGQTYNAGDSTNTTIPLPTDLTLSTTFPSSKIVFTPAAGEVSAFSAGQNTVTLKNTSTNKQTVLQINKYGTITSIQ